MTSWPQRGAPRSVGGAARDGASRRGGRDATAGGGSGSPDAARRPAGGDPRGQRDACRPVSARCSRCASSRTCPTTRSRRSWAMNRNSVAQLISRARIALRDALRAHGAALDRARHAATCERALPLIAMRDDGQLTAAGDAGWLDAPPRRPASAASSAREAMAEAGASYRIWAPVAAFEVLRRETIAEGRRAPRPRLERGRGEPARRSGPTRCRPAAGGARERRPRRRRATRRRDAGAARAAAARRRAGATPGGRRRARRGVGARMPPASGARRAAPAARPLPRRPRSRSRKRRDSHRGARAGQRCILLAAARRERRRRRASGACGRRRSRPPRRRGHQPRAGDALRPPDRCAAQARREAPQRAASRSLGRRRQRRGAPPRAHSAPRCAAQPPRSSSPHRRPRRAAGRAPRPRHRRLHRHRRRRAPAWRHAHARTPAPPPPPPPPSATASADPTGRQRALVATAASAAPTARRRRRPGARRIIGRQAAPGLAAGRRSVPRSRTAPRGRGRGQAPSTRAFSSFGRASTSSARSFSVRSALSRKPMTRPGSTSSVVGRARPAVAEVLELPRALERAEVARRARRTSCASAARRSTRRRHRRSA